MDPALCEFPQEHVLVRKNAGGRVIEVVDAEQRLVQEARRSCARKDMGCPYPFDVPTRTLRLVPPLFSAQPFLLIRREVIRHGVPNGARELEDLAIEGSETG